VAATNPPSSPPDALALLRSAAYVRLLVLAAIIGMPVSAAAYGFLEHVATLQNTFFTSLPHPLGFDPVPDWWPLLPPVLAGLLVAPVSMPSSPAPAAATNSSPGSPSGPPRP
jgi:hypothetical protein